MQEDRYGPVKERTEFKDKIDEIIEVQEDNHSKIKVIIFQVLNHLDR